MTKILRFRLLLPAAVLLVTVLGSGAANACIVSLNAGTVHICL